jgi:hypothetical protein
VQTGQTPPSAKPMKGIESGVFEIIDDYDTNTYRAIYTVKQPEISRLKSGKFSYYSVERLMRFLERLNCVVRIHIARPENEGVERVIAI